MWTRLIVSGAPPHLCKFDHLELSRVLTMRNRERLELRAFGMGREKVGIVKCTRSILFLTRESILPEPG